MRKTAIYTVARAGRDKGKQFLLTEMSAAQAERWAMRAFLAIARGGIEVPDDIAEAGLAGIATMGMKALGAMSFDDVELLANEMFTCIQAIPDPTNPTLVTPLFPESVADVATRLILRKEVFKLHVDFSSLADGLSLASAASKSGA